jgi:hypothetical protein
MRASTRCGQLHCPTTFTPHGQWLRERGHSVIVIVNDTFWIPGKPVLMFSLELKVSTLIIT